MSQATFRLRGYRDGAVCQKVLAAAGTPLTCFLNIGRACASAWTCLRDTSTGYIEF